jgi:hypothetical protein
MTMKSFVILLATLAFAQSPAIRNERWGMTQDQVVAAEKGKPAKRNDHVIIYRDKEVGFPAQVIFEFTAGKLDEMSYVLDDPNQNPDTVFLTWVLDMTKRYGKGEVFVNGKMAGQPGLVLKDRLDEFWKAGKGEIMVIYPPMGTTYVGVGINITKTEIMVEEDFTTKPNAVKPDAHWSFE